LNSTLPTSHMTLRLWSRPICAAKYALNDRQVENWLGRVQLATTSLLWRPWRRRWRGVGRRCDVHVLPTSRQAGRSTAGGHVRWAACDRDTWSSARRSLGRLSSKRSENLPCLHKDNNKLCAWRHDMPPPVFSPPRSAPPSRRNVAVLSHAEYVTTLTSVATLRVKACWVKGPGDLHLWPFDLERWCPSHVWHGLPLCRFNFGLPRPLCSLLRPDIRDRKTLDVRQTSDVRQKHRLMPPAY